MSVVTSAAAPLALFGDLDGDVWGVVVGGSQPRAAVGRLTDAGLELRPAGLDTDEDGIWTLVGGGCDLRLERADATTATDDDGDGGWPLEPCRVSGSVELDGNRRELDVGGIRSSALGAEGLDSLRLFAAWFAAGHEIAMLTARPRGAKGHDRDGVAVVARGEEHPLAIDPRLSTTYSGAGTPVRVGVELWLGDDPDGEDLAARRVAGSFTGSTVSTDAAIPGTGLSAYAFECASRGERGAGVYLLLRG